VLGRWTVRRRDAPKPPHLRNFVGGVDIAEFEKSGLAGIDERGNGVRGVRAVPFVMRSMALAPPTLANLFLFVLDGW